MAAPTVVTNTKAATEGKRLLTAPLAASDLPTSAVTPGTYTNATVTVDEHGVVQFAATGTGGGGGASFADLFLIMGS